MRIALFVLSSFLSFASCSRSPLAVADARSIDDALEHAERERIQAELRTPPEPDTRLAGASVLRIDNTASVLHIRRMNGGD